MGVEHLKAHFLQSQPLRLPSSKLLTSTTHTLMTISTNLTIDSNDETKAKFIQELINECMEVLKSNPDNRYLPFYDCRIRYKNHRQTTETRYQLVDIVVIAL